MPSSLGRLVVATGELATVPDVEHTHPYLFDSMKHPIEVPPLLFAEWWAEGLALNPRQSDLAAAYVARKAAEWAADQQIEKCCEYIAGEGRWFTNPVHRVAELRAAMRPKPPSLKEQALLQLDTLNAYWWYGKGCDLSRIRRALESIPDANEP